MTSTQFFIVLKVTEWCNKNLKKMKEEGKTIEEMSFACIDSISEYGIIHPSIIHKYVGACAT